MPSAVRDNKELRRYELDADGHTAFSEYQRDGNTIEFRHTEVPKALEGRGIGSALAKAALGYARLNHLKVKPFCPFMAGYISKHPEWHDLVHPDFREKLGL
jgi:predicted GNAT family acetyltransferase